MKWNMIRMIMFILFLLNNNNNDLIDGFQQWTRRNGTTSSSHLRKRRQDMGIPELDRKLTYSLPNGYQYSTNVADMAFLDRDQLSIMNALSNVPSTSTSSSSEKIELAFQTAEYIYNFGGHSQSVAFVDMKRGLDISLPSKTSVTGPSMDGNIAQGRLFQGYEEGTSNIRIEYIISDFTDFHVCHVGGLEVLQQEVTSGCFAMEGELEILGESYGYEYDYLLDNTNHRTISRLSGTAEGTMLLCNDHCPMKEFYMYYKYYGDPNYAHQWILGALTNDRALLKNVNVDFNDLSPPARADAVTGGTIYLSFFMFVLKELEDAIAHCDETTSMESWDNAVALYTGSIQTISGTDSISGGDGGGVLLFGHAQYRCHQFNTCDTKTGIANVNNQIFIEFDNGRKHILQQFCSDPIVGAPGYTARINVDRIAQLMAIPLIQGILQTYYDMKKASEDLDNVDEEKQAIDLMKGQGLSLMVGLLPKVHNCNEDVAILLRDAMTTIGSNNNDGASQSHSFEQVRKGLESTYTCLGITCKDIGGLLKEDGIEYENDFHPCIDSSTSSNNGDENEFLNPTTSTSTNKEKGLSMNDSTNNNNNEKQQHNVATGIAIFIIVLGLLVIGFLSWWKYNDFMKETQKPEFTETQSSIE